MRVFHVFHVNYCRGAQNGECHGRFHKMRLATLPVADEPGILNSDVVFVVVDDGAPCVETVANFALWDAVNPVE